MLFVYGKSTCFTFFSDDLERRGNHSNELDQLARRIEPEVKRLTKLISHKVIITILNAKTSYHQFASLKRSCKETYKALQRDGRFRSYNRGDRKMC